MRILLVCQYFWPENFRVNDLASELVARGHQVTVLTGLPNYPDGKFFSEYLESPRRYLNFRGVEVIRVPIFPRGSGGFRLVVNYISYVFSAVIIGAWKLRGRRFDVVFVNQLSPVTMAIPGVFFSRIKRAPLIMWVLDLWPETLSAVGAIRSSWFFLIIEKLVSFIYRKCSLVLVQSRSFVSSVRARSSDGLKIRYFPNWAEDLFRDSSCVDPAPEVVDCSDCFNVLFAGNIGESQDFPSILDAAEKLRFRPNLRWLIVGDGRNAAWVREQVDQRNLSTQVKILGRFAVDRMPSFYAHADVLLVALRREPVFAMTIPGKIQSYLMAGVPVIGMLDGEGAQVIRDSNSGFACPAGDSDGLVAAVNTMMSISEEDRRRLGENGRRFAQANFERRKQLDSLESFFCEAVSSRQKKSFFRNIMKRFFDFFAAAVALLVFSLPISIVWLLVRVTSPGPAIYWSDRIGRNNRVFRMPKFRSMYIDTPAVATHLLSDPSRCITPIGRVLRRTSLDELPQLWSILVGDMSVVGPRPALYNQTDLIELRTARGVHLLQPGLTGWAQVNGRDELPIPQKVEFDVEYLERQSFGFDLRIIWLTVLKVLRSEGVAH